jgi:hypothetical protein
MSTNPDLSFLKIYSDTNHIDKVVKSGQATILTTMDAKVSEHFDVTLRNLNNPFFSSPTSTQAFNN